MTKMQVWSLVLCCVIFLGLGVITGGLGPVLPELAAHNGVDLASAGTIFTALFLGSLAAQFFAGPLGDRWGIRPVLLVGLVLLAGGVGGLTATPSMGLTLACTLLAGIGHGMVDLGGNVMIAGVFAKKSLPALNLVNVFFGVGAVGGPWIVSQALGVWQTGLPALWIGAGLLLLMAAPLGALHLPAGQADEKNETGGSLYRAPLLWALAAFLLLYVGIETGVGGWAAAYMQQTAGFAAGRAALVASGFWMMLTVGRLAAALVGARLAPMQVLLASLGCALLGALLFPLSVGWPAGSLAAIFLLGLGYGPIFPTTMAVITAAFARQRGTAAGLAVALGSLGGMSVPWLQGVLLQNAGPLAAALVPLAGLALMIGLYAGVRGAPKVEARQREDCMLS